jgi:hypothetical protein
VSQKNVERSASKVEGPRGGSLWTATGGGSLPQGALGGCVHKVTSIAPEVDFAGDDVLNFQI